MPAGGTVFRSGIRVVPIACTRPDGVRLRHEERQIRLSRIVQESTHNEFLGSNIERLAQAADSTGAYAQLPVTGRQDALACVLAGRSHRLAF
jgi:hypothetical protein